MRLSPLALGATLACVACRPEAVALRPPEPGHAIASEPATTDEPESPEPSNVEEGTFAVTLANQCRDTWSGSIVRNDEGDDARAGASSGGFEVHSAATRELWLRPGDALVLTTPSGGILAVPFDGIPGGYGARIEVNPECSGIKRTMVPAAGSH